MVDATVTNGQLATHLSDLLETVSDKSMVTEETVKTPEINDSTTTDMDVLFDELTNLKDRAKEKALNATALRLPKSDNMTETTAVNSDALDEDPVGRDVFAGRHSIGVAQDTVVSSKTTDTSASSNVSSSQQPNVSSSQKLDVTDKSLIKVFAVNGQVYWYNRDKLAAHSAQAIEELSEQDAIDSGMRHASTEGPTAKTYFTKEELEARRKKDVTTTENVGATVENTVDTNIKSLPRTGDISAPAPLASVSMDLGVALLMVLKKRKKKDQERFAD